MVHSFLLQWIFVGVLLWNLLITITLIIKWRWEGGESITHPPPTHTPLIRWRVLLPPSPKFLVGDPLQIAGNDLHIRVERGTARVQCFCLWTLMILPVSSSLPLPPPKQLTGTHLHTWSEGHIARVMYFAWEHFARYPTPHIQQLAGTISKPGWREWVRVYDLNSQHPCPKATLSSFLVGCSSVWI